ncbi:class II aldolase/adducin family protein [Phenylobacterium montanum]|uniref:Class II aldolase/adducin family protein n=1 Tax=Phenylobacterium montanum TaxID=2823693 RepID=A0A975G460_9CAUL|nr:class II aldolase/adducin family protein [Caulobacter sp. S6]QUD90247.1 class II aldolase/adducin family protein [Caulobacter sp. S6]
MTTGSEAAARTELVQAYKEVVGLGLTELSSGNISVRFGEGMLISPTGASGDTITEDSLVYVGPDGGWEAGRRPSSEWQLHARVYRENADTNAIVHTHSDYCVAVACHCKPLPGFHYMVGVFGGDDVPCVPYNTFGSEELARDVALALRARTACLMGNHGATARGKHLDAAVKGAHRLEISCRHYIHSLAIGEPRLLTPEEWADFHRRIGNSGYAK